MAIFEQIDKLNLPYDIYYFDTEKFWLPIRAHWHYYMEILYVIEGQIDVEYDQTRRTLKPGDLIIMYPTVVHSIFAATDERIVYAVVKFDPMELKLPASSSSVFRTLFSNSSIPEGCFVHFTAAQLSAYTIKPIINSMITELETKHFGHNVTINAWLCMLLVSLARVWEENGICLSTAKPKRGLNDLSSTLEYIDSHYNEPLSIGELAERCNMSYSTFSRFFKQQTGRSCKEHIEYTRVCKAQELLMFTDHPLNYIATETGFSDCSHLIKVYKKVKGITPAQQRKIGFQNGDPSTVS